MNQTRLNMLFRIGRLFEPAYSRLMTIRSGLYQKNIFKVNRVCVPVISVGNLLMGGTGKTPHVIAICRQIQRSGGKPAVVTRGYGGRVGKGPLVISDGTGARTTVEHAGDEPFMMAEQLPGIPVIAGSRRYKCAEAAVKNYHADIIVLDDGFQHMALHRDLDIVLVPALHPMGNRHVFPAGELREPVAALQRAHCIVITGCDGVSEAEAEILRAKLHAEAPALPVFTSGNRPGPLKILKGDIPGIVTNDTLPSEIKFFSICAIGAPEHFYAMLTRTGLCLCGAISYRDHHFYTWSDMEKIYRMASRAGADAIVTTAKDSVKLKPLMDNAKPDGMPVCILDMEAVPEKGFWRYVGIKTHKHNTEYDMRSMTIS